MKALIVGGGIAGYTCALALQKFGIDYELFESQGTTARQGAGIWLSPNGLKVLEEINPEIVSILKEVGHVSNDFGMIHKSGKPISLMKMNEVEREFGYRHIMIHRNELQKLLESFITGTIHFNKKLTAVNQTAQQVSVEFTDQTLHTGNILIGCDGVGSKVRDNLFPKVKERDSGQYCWRAIVDYVPKENYQNSFFEQNGEPGVRAAYAPVNDHQVYFFVTAKVDKIDKNIKQQLMDLVGDFPYDIKGVIEASKQENWIIKPLNDFAPINEWYNNRTVLVGDAAHAMTPNMGQGGNQAIESAFVLARCLSEENYSEAFKKYQGIRKDHVDDVTQKSWQFGKLVGMKPKFIRDMIFHFISKTSMEKMVKQMSKVYRPTYLN